MKKCVVFFVVVLSFLFSQTISSQVVIDSINKIELPLKNIERDSINKVELPLKNVVVDSVKIDKKVKKLKFGCGFGLNFVGATSINVAPNLTYKVSDKIAFGAGIQGGYSSIKNLQTTINYGANLISNYSPFKNAQTILEFVQQKVDNTTEISGLETKTNFWESALFVGAGYIIANKVSLGAKYNMLYNKDKSVYTSPIVPFVNIIF